MRLDTAFLGVNNRYFSKILIEIVDQLFSCSNIVGLRAESLPQANFLFSIFDLDICLP